MPKKILLIIIAVLLCAPCAPHAGAQTTEGTEFWVTAGTSSPPPFTDRNFQIRIVSGSTPTDGTIYFTNLDESIPFDLGAHEVYTYVLTPEQKPAIYNNTTGITNHSIHITSNKPITVYTMDQGFMVTTLIDATNIFPATVLDVDYYQISYKSFFGGNDAYAVVATQNNTNLYHNGDWEATLDAGEVYYRSVGVDMTGNHIISDKPVAFFALCRYTTIPEGPTGFLMQQLAPVNTWGKNFFVPISNVSPDRVRIVASQNGTNVEQTGGIVITGTGGQSILTNLKAGDFVELEISGTGCHIKANNPIGVCTFLRSVSPSPGAAQCWVPALEQSISCTQIAPFIPVGSTDLSGHFALVCTPTITRGNTTVSVGGLPPTSLFGGSWIENVASEMSFYSMPLNSSTESYLFTNSAGLIILGYGYGPPRASYYYLAGSAMRDLSAAFTANNIPYNALSEHLFCEDEITFVANIQGIHPDAGSLKWYINNVLQTDLTDQLTWNKTFAIGNHVIKMEVKFEDESTETYEGILKIESCEEGPAFYANDIHHQDLPNTTFCDKKVNFRAEIDEEDLHPDAGH
ncbi:MAG: IgGFc-binding protein, partial [Bacteroidales bacterium]|nr:IgGFc-binding protein [Bacteroidales bacterium]